MLRNPTAPSSLLQAHHCVSMPEPGHVEHDAESVWWADVVSLCTELLANPTGGIAAVGVSGIGPCVVPCTEGDVPLRPAILYGVDTRASVEVAELTELLGEQEILRRCGSVLSSQALGPKLCGSRATSRTWAATERWHMASSFATARLTGELGARPPLGESVRPALRPFVPGLES